MVPGSVIDHPPPIKRNPWADNLFRPLLITAMIMCFNISLVNLVQLINPAWRGTYFLIGMLLTTVEALYSFRLLKTYRSRDTSMVRYRAAEWGTLILFLKFLSLADKPLALVWADLQAMWRNPLNVVNLEFYVMLVLAVTCWVVATETITDFEDLYDPYTFRSAHVVPLDRLAARFFVGGVLLVLISGLTHVILTWGVRSLTDLGRPTIEGVLLNVLIYFMLGLVLLGQANLARLMMRWQLQKVEIGSGFVKQWAKYGLIFLGIVTLAAFFLPTRYTLGFLTSASIIIQSIMNILMLILQLIFLLFTLPLAWLMSSLGMGSAPPPALPALATPPPEAPVEGAPLPWLEALRSLIFWLVALIVLWYLLKIYLSDRPELVAALKRFKPIGFVLNLLKQIWQSLRRAGQMGFDLISGSVNLSAQTGGVTGLLRSLSGLGLDRLSPRERIFYYYLNILKRAEKWRLARKIHQTPYEYEPNLEQAVPEVEADVQALTEVFVRARYSQEGFDEEHANLVKQQWQHIRQALRNLSRSDSKIKKL